MNARWTVSLVVVALVAAACGGDDGTGDAGDPIDQVPVTAFDVDAAAGAWVLTEADIDGSRLDLADVRVTLDLSPGEIAGSGGCNGYGGDIAIADDGTVTVGNIASTLMACQGPAGEIESQYLRALGDATELMLEDDAQVLVLTSTDSIWTFHRDADGDGAPDTDADPLDGDWEAVDATTRGVRIDLSDPAVGVTVEIDGDQIRGTAACNGYAGSLDSDRGRSFGTFVVTELSWTEMGCEPALMAIEQAFLQALQDIDSYEVADGLYLGSPELGSSIHLVRQEPVEASSFEATEWELDTFIEGDAASNWPAMDEVHLRFTDDGGLHGATGCAVIDGTWRRTGSELELTELERTEIAGLDCDDEDRELDSLVVGVLQGLDLTATVEARRLTITARTDAGPSGLSFRVRYPSADRKADHDDLDALAEEHDLDADGGIDGPVMYARRTDATDTMAAEIEGELVLEDDCLYAANGSNRFPVLWPFGTYWDATSESVVLPVGVPIAIGEQLDGGGGYLGAGAIAGFASSDEVADLADRCAEPPYREIAVLQSW